MSKEKNIIELQHVRKCYEKDIAVIEDFSLEVKKGEFITFLGPSGCGKTTILRMIGGFDLQGMYRYVLDGTELLWYFGEPAPYSIMQEIYLEFLPLEENENIRSGVWKMLLIPQRLIDGRIDLWMPSGSSINRETGFLVSDADRTLTIPSTATNPITVGAYDGNTDSYAPFSGR